MQVENLSQIIAMGTALVSIVTLILLFCRGRLRTPIRVAFLIIFTILGFVLFAPLFPLQLQMLLLDIADPAIRPLPFAFVGIGVFILITFGYGRVVCGYICPIGAIQELAYHTPGKKLELERTAIGALGDRRACFWRRPRAARDPRRQRGLHGPIYGRTVRRLPRAPRHGSLPLSPILSRALSLRRPPRTRGAPRALQTPAHRKLYRMRAMRTRMSH